MLVVLCEVLVLHRHVDGAGKLRRSVLETETEIEEVCECLQDILQKTQP